MEETDIVSKLLNFKRLLTIDESIHLLRDLIGEHITQDAIKLKILQRHQEINKVSNTVLSNFFAEANRELEKTKR